MARTKARNNDSSANLGFEARLWAAADALRNNMDAAEYKHVVLGLIFLKYIRLLDVSCGFEFNCLKFTRNVEEPHSFRGILM